MVNTDANVTQTFYTGAIAQAGEALVERHTAVLTDWFKNYDTPHENVTETNLKTLKMSADGFTPAIMTEQTDGVAHRLAKNIESYTAIVLDLDHINADLAIKEVLYDALSSVFTDFPFITYPSLSSGFKDNGLRYRVIIPLDGTITPNENKTIITKFTDTLIAQGVLTERDGSNKATSRAYALPIATQYNDFDIHVHNVDATMLRGTAVAELVQALNSKQQPKPQTATAEPVIEKQTDFVNKVRVWANNFPDRIKTESEWFATICHLKVALNRNEITQDEVDQALYIFAEVTGGDYTDDDNMARARKRFDELSPNPSDTGASYFDSGFYDSMQRVKDQSNSSNDWYKILPPKHEGARPRLDVFEDAYIDYVSKEALFMHDPDNIFGATIQYNKNTGTWSRKSDYVGTIRQWVQQDLYERSIINYTSQRQRDELVRIAHTQADTNSQFANDPLNSNDGSYIAFANGTLDLKSGTLLPHSSDYFIGNAIPHDYIEQPVDKAQIPNTMAFLESIVPTDAIDWLIKFIGSIAYTSPRATKDILILNGSGANGKSTLINHINHMYGTGNISNVPLEDLTNKDHRFAKSGLVDKMLNTASELSGKYLDDTTDLKSLTGADPVNGEYKGKNAFSFVNHAKLLFATNKLPALSDTTNGMYRRFKLINFTADFTKQTETEKQAFINLMAKVDSETELFLSYAVQQYMKVLSGVATMNTPKSMDEQLNDWFLDNNPIEQFANELLEFDENLIDHEFNKTSISSITTKSDGETIKNLYEIYKDWSEDTGVKTVARKRFEKDLASHFKTKSVLNRTHNKQRRNVIAGVKFNGTDNDYVTERRMTVGSPFDTPQTATDKKDSALPF